MFTSKGSKPMHCGGMKRNTEAREISFNNRQGSLIRFIDDEIE